jgi:hypothetical protein
LVLPLQQVLEPLARLVLLLLAGGARLRRLLWLVAFRVGGVVLAYFHLSIFFSSMFYFLPHRRIV